MKVAEKIMFAFLLISEGAEEQDVREFLVALDEGLGNDEEDARFIYDGLMKRLDGDIPGITGEVVRLMKAKIQLDENSRKFGLLLSGMEKVISILNVTPKNDMAAKIVLKKALNSVDEVKTLADTAVTCK